MDEAILWCGKHDSAFETAKDRPFCVPFVRTSCHANSFNVAAPTYNLKLSLSL